MKSTVRDRILVIARGVGGRPPCLYRRGLGARQGQVCGLCPAAAGHCLAGNGGSDPGWFSVVGSLRRPHFTDVHLRISVIHG